MPVYKNKKGREGFVFRCYFTNEYGERKQHTSGAFSSRREAKKAEREYLLAVEKRAYNPTKITFESVWLNYLNSIKSVNSPNTLYQKEKSVNKYLSDLFKYDIHNISPMALKKVLDPIDKSTSQKNSIHSILSQIFKYAEKFYSLESNPMDKIDRFKRTDDELMKEMTFLTVEEFNQFYECCCKKNKEFADFYYILLWSGCRKNELRSLTFSCVGFDKNQIVIKRQLTKDGKWQTLKTASSNRKITLDEKSMEILKSQYDKYSKYKGFDADKWFVFGGFKPLCISTINKYVNDVVKSDGNLKPFRVHDLRHSHVSFLIESGVTPYKISKRLGHTSINTTLNKYGHLIDSEEKDIINAINALK